MSVRTTPGAVTAILGGSTSPNSHYDGTTDVTPFIDSASSIVDTLAAKASPSLSVSQLEIIERWLSAHFYTAYDQMFTNKTTGKASAGFMDTGGEGFCGTPYGKMAVRLDPTRYLAALDNKGVVGMTWLGKYPPDQKTQNSDGSFS